MRNWQALMFTFTKLIWGRGVWLMCFNNNGMNLYFNPFTKGAHSKRKTSDDARMNWHLYDLTGWRGEMWRWMHDLVYVLHFFSLLAGPDMRKHLYLTHFEFHFKIIMIGWVYTICATVHVISVMKKSKNYYVTNACNFTVVIYLLYILVCLCEFVNNRNKWCCTGTLALSNVHWN